MLTYFIIIFYKNSLFFGKLSAIHKAYHFSIMCPNFFMFSIYFNRETLLRSDESSKIMDMTKTLVYISHEYAHQWFGNLVTCKWWNDLWLNEGLATYVHNEIAMEVSIVDIFVTSIACYFLFSVLKIKIMYMVTTTLFKMPKFQTKRYSTRRSNLCMSG